MSEKEEHVRFVRIYKETSRCLEGHNVGTSSVFRDNETGILYHQMGTNALTPLYGADGKILVDNEFLCMKIYGGEQSSQDNGLGSTIQYSEEEEALFNKLKNI